MRRSLQAEMYTGVNRLLTRMKKGMRLALMVSPLLVMSTSAHALKLSNLSSGWKSEMAAIAPVILLGIMALGIIMAGWAAISGVIAKKNQEPLRWQLFGVIGGAVAITIPAILLAFAGSLSDGNDNAGSVLNDLQIDY
ncbi:hypothetical protein [Stutzerimonas stutzeri]|uniref:hypothetical protein n=1 Tax=Stutzerimonas stutzeri TaxID=316 RepID=UPI00265D238F|nr:hypothetical protein [Stutzerimonas stutzeri]MCF6783420.1 hypothetical protein [Stutzerimonas stutzeri]